MQVNPSSKTTVIKKETDTSAQFEKESCYLKKVQPIYDFFARRKLKRNPSFRITLRELCERIDLPMSSYSELSTSVLECIVMEICQAGTRMVNGSVCVQMYGDTDEKMEWAVKHGAIAVVTSHKISGVPSIVVPEPQRIYAKMCGIYRALSNISVTAIIGSIGKTTTKKMVNSVYDSIYNTFCDAGNENLLFNAGYHCQHIPSKAEVWVQEVSEDTPGYAQLISEMISPRIVIITAIDKSHIGNFDSEEGIVREVCSITKGMPFDGVVIINKDEFHAYHLIEGYKVISVSESNKEADYYIEDLTLTNEGIVFRVVVKSDHSIHNVFMRDVYARHNAVSALYAFACGCVSGIPYEKIIKGIEKYRAVGIRQNVYRTFLSHNIVYADCYNAVAKSVRAAVETCSQIALSGKKRVAVLGDIEESGNYSKEIHDEICDIINKSTFSVVLFYGEKLISSARQFRFRNDLTVHYCSSHNEIYDNLHNLVCRGDLILFKSSRKSQLETCIKRMWPLSYFYENALAKLPYILWRIRVIIN